jgi:hypothetical protein
MIVIFEKLTNGFLNRTLEDVSKFLNIEFDRKRLSCIIKHSEGSFHREKKCFKKTSLRNTSNLYENTTNDIFTTQQKEKINMAILNVNEAITKRGLTPLPLSDYQSTVIRLSLCPYQ